MGSTYFGSSLRTVLIRQISVDSVELTLLLYCFRYGSPGNVVNKEYQQFAEWYLPTFTGGILEALLKVLDQYRNKIYVSPRVLTEILKYIKTA